MNLRDFNSTITESQVFVCKTNLCFALLPDLGQGQGEGGTEQAWLRQGLIYTTNWKRSYMEKAKRHMGKTLLL